MGVTIEDVARRAGVSRGTVSNVLNRPEIVLEATRQKVLAAMRELNFVPSQAARMLGGARNRSIGLVVHDVGNPFFAEVAHGVEDAASPLEYIITLTSTRADDQRQQASLRLLLAQHVSGVLLTPTVSGTDGLRQLREEGVPAVLLDYEGGVDECSVAVDDVRGGMIATRHLLDRGHRSLAFVGGPRRVRQHADRLKGMRNALTGMSPKPAVRVVSTQADTIAAGEEAAKTLRGDGTKPLPTGVFCGNDLLAVGLMRGLTSCGVRVPEDVAIVGYDDIELASLVATPITSVRQPMYEMGRAATELLLAEIRDTNHVHQHLRFVPELVIRDSTAPSRSADAS
ncbi:MAG TPA: LacI family DNA-binding transcriptional regulator [Actinopolymorphaceae bacterium]|jgi:LacI family transcriptional regulator